MADQTSAPPVETRRCTVGDYARALLFGLIGAAIVAFLYYFAVGLLHILPLMFPVFGVVVAMAVWMAVGERRDYLLPVLAAALGFLGVFVGRMGAVLTEAARRSIAIAPDDLLSATWESLTSTTWGNLVITAAIAGIVTHALLVSPPHKKKEAEPEADSTAAEATSSPDDPSGHQPAQTAE